jgi:hypothetical protein
MNKRNTKNSALPGSTLTIGLDGEIVNGNLQLGYPDPELGTCWRYSGRGNFTSGSDQCNKPNESWYTGYQSDFIY